jgi:hypothetical protein
MIRAAAVPLALALFACGSKNHPSICVEQPAPAACMQTCNASGANTCPLGFFCNPNGKCDAECTPGGTQCGANAFCTADGHCMGNGSGTDANNCPAVHFTPMPTTPAIEIVLDRSGSMTMNDIPPSRFQAMEDGLFNATTGAVTTTQNQVYFGELMFAGDQTPCLLTTGFTVPRALNNASALQSLTASHPPNGGSTPTANAIDAAVADFAANPPPAGTSPIILLATDGQPNSCGGGGGTGPSITSVKNAYTAGIRTFILGLAGVADQYLQDIANAGTGRMTGQSPNCASCAPFYTANNPATLSAALTSIITGVLSCDLTITGMVDPATASQGTVTLNGMVLTYGTDWTVDPNGTTIHLLGNACSTLKNSTNPTVDASFPCGVVIQ